MAFLPPTAEQVSQHLAVVRQDGKLTFFNASGPIFECREDDGHAMRVAAVILSEPKLGLATAAELAPVFGRHASRIVALRRLYKEGGSAALAFKARGPKGPIKLKDATIAKAQELLDQRKSQRAIAKALGVDEKSIRRAMREGRLHPPGGSPSCINGDSDGGKESPSTPTDRSAEDAICAGGVATKRELERALAATGQLVEAPPRFESATSVAGAGVLVALPALLSEGAVEVGQETYRSLKNGYYGLTAVLLTFAFMALMRIRSPEGLSKHAPGELGVLLGLDRVPEMKTLRRKLAELASRGRAQDLAAAFTKRWAEEDPDALGFLYVDGHVRPYHGRTHIIPKTHVQQRRMCMPATTDYWVNDANAEPLMFVTAPANDGLLAMMDKHLLPRIREVVGDDRRVTLAFDREGWSPKRFVEWHAKGFDVLTYRKGKYADWRRNCFKPFEVTVSGRREKYMLAERVVPLQDGFRVREVRRLCDNGHQTAVVTTRRDLPLDVVARRMFDRWKQENYFRYMRHEFALDHLVANAVEAADPQRTVPNPARKAKVLALKRARAELKQAEQALGKVAHDNEERSRPTVRGFKIANSQLRERIEAERENCDRLAAELRELPKRVPVVETVDGKPVVQLERERKTIMDVFKMVAYRAETQLANLVGPLLPFREDEARKFMCSVFALPADVLPDYDKGALEVRLHSMSTPRHNRALAGLCEALNELEAVYPGTSLRLVFRAAEPPPSPSDAR